MSTRYRATCLALLAAAVAALPGHAQNAPSPEILGLELNAIETTAAGCTMSFLVTNGLGTDIGAMVLEAVLFDTAERVERLTLFDFGALPAMRPRVRQFVVPGAACDAFSAVLINGADTCEAGGAPASLCDDALIVRSRTDIELIG